MSSNVCPRCNIKGPVKLAANQVCKRCQSAQVWARLGRGNQVIVIKPEVEDAENSSKRGDTQEARGGLSWEFLFLSFALTVSVVAVLIYFYRQPPAELLPEQLLNRFSNLATGAVILGGLAMMISAGTFYHARYKGYDERLSMRVAGLIVIGLATVAFATAFSCWAKTERVQALSPEEHASADPLLKRLSSATTVIHALNTHIDRYRSAKGMGVIIGYKAGRMWILTVPYAEESSWRNLTSADALWVNFSDGRSLPGQLRWAAEPPVNLAIIEVKTDSPLAQVQFHPIAEAVIPSGEVLVVGNPLSAGWRLEHGTILKRQGQRTENGWNCLVNVDLNTQRNDIGSGMYDTSGQLLGLNAGIDRLDGTAKFVIISSAMISRIKAAEESDNLDALKAVSLDRRQP